MSQEWALWTREHTDWQLADVGLCQETALRYAVERNATEARMGTGTAWVATPADTPPPSLSRDPQVTLPERPCLALGGVCTRPAGHDGEHSA